MIEGENLPFSEIERNSLQAEVSLLMKCGSSISYMIPTQDGNYFRYLAIHFHLDVLKKIFENEIPVALKENDNLQLSNFVRVESKALIKHYIDGIMLYFRSPPALITEELLILKV